MLWLQEPYRVEPVPRADKFHMNRNETCHFFIFATIKPLKVNMITAKRRVPSVVFDREYVLRRHLLLAVSEGRFARLHVPKKYSC